MKIKLASLLMFSQAAAQTVIDKNNYRENLCDDNLFKITSSASPTATSSSEGEKGIIHQHYQEYCISRSQYDRAVEDKNHGFRNMYPCVGNTKDMLTRDLCIQKTGIALAKTCKTLKQDKSGHQKSWNDVMPTLESCNNARRR